MRPKLLYTIPDHQNPAGVSMSTERRERLVELARRHGFLIVEDVAYRELVFEGDPLPSLWSLAPDVVVQLGTRFGLLAVLPLPDVDASLREIEYAFDSLKAVGVGLLSNWKDKWIGDSSFTPVLDELNGERRS